MAARLPASQRTRACFMDDFEACIAHLRFPVTHRWAIRTTNLLERHRPSWTIWRSSIVSRLGGKRVDRPCRRINPRPLVRLKEGRL